LNPPKTLRPVHIYQAGKTLHGPSWPMTAAFRSLISQSRHERDHTSNIHDSATLPVSSADGPRSGGRLELTDNIRLQCIHAQGFELPQMPFLGERTSRWSCTIPNI